MKIFTKIKTTLICAIIQLIRISIKYDEMNKKVIAKINNEAETVTIVEFEFGELKSRMYSR